MEAGFKRAGEAVKRRLILAISGAEKSGKTRFSLTAPPPVAVLNLDIGLEGVVQQFSDKEIFVSEYRVMSPSLNKNMSQEAIATNASNAWDSILRDYKYALDTMRTVVLDTATEVWEVLRMARFFKTFGKLDHIKPHHYGPVNAEYRDFLRLAYDSNANLILVHKVKAEYINDVRTGRLERAGFGDTGFIVQCNARTYRDDEGFHLEVSDCRQNMSLCGTVLSEEMCSFPFLASLVFDGTSLEDWE